MRPTYEVCGRDDDLHAITALLTTIARGVLRLLERAEPRVDRFVIVDILAAMERYGVDVTDTGGDHAEDE